MNFLYDKSKDNYSFLLTPGISLRLACQEPPFYSYLRFEIDGILKHEISLRSELAQKICEYFEVCQTKPPSTASFIAQLNDWDLNDFALLLSSEIEVIPLETKGITPE